MAAPALFKRPLAPPPRSDPAETAPAKHARLAAANPNRIEPRGLPWVYRTLCVYDMGGGTDESLVGQILLFYPDTTTPADAALLHNELLATYNVYEDHDNRTLFSDTVAFLLGAVLCHTTQTLRDMTPTQRGAWVDLVDLGQLRMGLPCSRYTELTFDMDN